MFIFLGNHSKLVHL